MKIVIRPLEKTDFDAWLKLRLLLWPGAIEKHKKEMSELFSQSDFHAFVALDDKEPIGFAEASIRPYANGCETRPVGFLEGIYVDSSFRGHGIGRKFVEEIEKWARSKGCRELGSDTEIDNLSAVHAHLQWGFEETESVVCFRKELK